jgi:DNA polymerase III epsilon subunit-like protein
MRQIVIDTETADLNPLDGHRIVEIGAVELVDHSPTGRTRGAGTTHSSTRWSRVPPQPGLKRKGEFSPASRDHQKDGTSTERRDQQDEQIIVVKDQGRKSVEDGARVSHAYMFLDNQGPTIMTMTV